MAGGRGGEGDPRRERTRAILPAVPTAWYVRHRREEARRGILIGGGGSKDHADSARTGRGKIVSRVATLLQHQEAEAVALRASAASALSADAFRGDAAAAAAHAVYHRVPLGSGATRLPVLSGSRIPAAAADALAGRPLMRLIATPAIGAVRTSRVPARAGGAKGAGGGELGPAEAVERALGSLQVHALDDFGVRYAGSAPRRVDLPPPRRPAAEVIAEALEEARVAFQVRANACV